MLRDVLMILKENKIRDRVLNINESFVIQAPAGSGKTEILIQRYLTLLQYVEKPEEIIALTFTNKSANEMYDRIQKALILSQVDYQTKDKHKKKL